MKPIFIKLTPMKASDKGPLIVNAQLIITFRKVDNLSYLWMAGYFDADPPIIEVKETPEEILAKIEEACRCHGLEGDEG